MMSMGLPSEKPIPAAAQPEYEFSMEMTTGMSAPPMGMMMRKPSTKAIAVIVAKAVQFVGLAKEEPQAENNHDNREDQVDHMLTAKGDRRAAHAALTASGKQSPTPTRSWRR